MKVIHVQYAMPPAGNAAYRLHEAMRQAGIESGVLTIESSANKDFLSILPHTKTYYIKKALNAIYKKVCRSGLKKDAYFYSTMPFLSCGISYHKVIKEADVVYLHWVAGASLSKKDFLLLAQPGKPIIFFMHDMWTFTGGCHHSFDCNRYYQDCKGCKMFSSHTYSPHSQLLLKQEIFSKYPNIHFISPSKWMAERAIHSAALQGKEVYNIPNLIDENIFKPIDKTIVRSILNLPQDKHIITFGCVGGTKNPYKGWKYLRDAVNRLTLSNILIIVYGSGYNQQTVDEIKYPIVFMGNILDETKLSLISNASDVFVTPSLCENYSLVILEHILCGTPVVAFNCTGIPELVQTGQTGYLAKFKDTEDLARGIEKMIQYPIKITGWENYSSQDIVCQHLKLIEKITQI